MSSWLKGVAKTAAPRPKRIKPAPAPAPEAETFGKLSRTRNRENWKLEAEPHVIQMAKRLFKRSGRVAGSIKIGATRPMAVDLMWFMERYPLKMSDVDRMFLKMSARGHQAMRAKVRRCLKGSSEDLATSFTTMAVKPRDYQKRTASAMLSQGHILCADDLGTGKTCVGIAPMSSSEALPAIVVTMTSLPEQWVREVKKFAPHLRTKVIKNGAVHDLNGGGRGSQMSFTPDVVIISYSKLRKWYPALEKFGNYIVFDEVHELRNSDSAKYRAAVSIAKNKAFKMGLSATPVINYGDEVHSIYEVLAPGHLGTYEEFCQEWCVSEGRHQRIRDPAAFGSWMFDQGLMVRNTREMVGRELPPVTRVVHDTEVADDVYADMGTAADELAQIILTGGGGRGSAMRAGAELERILRQTTGLAKAPAVASFVEMLVASGEQVILAAWHHAVYDVYEERLSKANIKITRYTGYESPRQKKKSVEAFLNGDARVMLMSIRSGVGLDGLQKACRVVVFGEFDWAPNMHEQMIGRLQRDDGIGGGVLAYFMMSDSGSDLVMAPVLGMKAAQSDGLIDPEGKAKKQVFKASEEQKTKALARAWLERKGR